MKSLLLHNPTAGTEDHDRLDLIAWLEAAGYRPDYCSTKSARFPEVVNEDHEIIIIAGGDGTVRKVATQLRRRSAPLVIVPRGTANNVARSLQIPLDRFDMPRPHDVGNHLKTLDLGVARLGEEQVVLAEGLGLGALAATMDEKVGRGESGEAKIVAAREVVAKVIRKAEPFRVSCTVDGRAVEGEFLFVEALLHAFCGPALRLCPLADSGDGLLDIVFLEEARRDEMAAWVMSPENSDPPVRIERGRKFSVEWSRKPPIRSDDQRIDLPGAVKSIDLSVHRLPLKVVVPAATAGTADMDRKETTDGRTS